MVRKAAHSPPVQFHFDKVRLSLKERGELKTFLNDLVIKEKKKLNHLNYIFCSDKSILDINRKYLNHNFYTDVVTFDLSSTPGEIIGDIFISADRIRDNAKSLELPITTELYRVMLHGLLHLCGYNDKTENQRKLMRMKEDFYLNLYFRRFT